MTLDDFLGQFYSAVVLGHGSRDTAVAELAAAVALDPELQRAAQQRLGDINALETHVRSGGGALQDRDYTAFVQKQCLTLLVRPG